MLHVSFKTRLKTRLMTGLVAGIAILGLAVTTSAHADRKPLGEGLDIVVDNGSLLVLGDETDPECTSAGTRSIKPKNRVAARATALQAMLDQLGFQRVATEAATVMDRSSDENVKQLGNFDKAKLGLVVKNHTARVLRKNDVLATATVLDQLTGAQLIPSANVVVVSTLRPGREGCEGTDPTLITVLPIASKAP